MSGAPVSGGGAAAVALTLRDHFALAALPAIISATAAGQHHLNIPAEDPSKEEILRALTGDAYAVADAMLASRRGGGE